MMSIPCHRPTKISPGAFGSHHCRAGGGGGTPPVSSPPLCPQSCPALLRSLQREFSMRYLFVALLSVAMPSFAFAQPLTRSEEHTSELQSLMRISSAVFCLKNKKHTHQT